LGAAGGGDTGKWRPQQGQRSGAAVVYVAVAPALCRGL